MANATTTIPGQTLKWHRYFWLEFGAVDAQVKKIRIQCAVMPAAKK